MSGVIQQMVAQIQGGGQQTAQPSEPTYDPEKGYADQFNTQLTPQEEAAYQAWGQQEAAKRPDHRNPAQDTYDYDMRGFWKSGGQFAQNGHAGDQFKKPNHPTFSSLSQYSTPERMGGQWQKQQDGTWSFAPSQTNLKYNDSGDLQQYFGTVEKGNKLILPQEPPGLAPTEPVAPPVAAPMSALPVSPLQGATQGLAVMPKQPAAGAVNTKPLVGVT